MGRLIDADRLKAHYCWWAGGSKEMSIDEAKKTFDTIIDLQPTVDAEPVVRCKDCENWVENEHCLAWEYNYSDADGYCYLGKRRGLIGTQMSLSERKEDETD